MTPANIAGGYAAVLVFFLGTGLALAEPGCKDTAGRMATVQGTVEVQSSAGGAWKPAALNALLCEGDTIRVSEKSRATVTLINNAVLNISQNTTMRLLDITDKKAERSWIDVIKGAIQSFSRKPNLMAVNTPYLNGSIEGTEFSFIVKDGKARLTVFEGTVVASNDLGSVTVTDGGSAEAAQGQAPQSHILVNPRDEVVWTLYYPPIMAANAGHLAEAADLLQVGRVREASALLDDALAANPNDGMAYALRSVIHVTQNRRDEGLADATRAVELDDSAATRIALSYAQQAHMDIVGARDNLLLAADNFPQDALVQARLGELHLMLGDRASALAAASQAVSLAPNLARTQLVLGFSALAEFDNATALEAFGKAIEFDDADPMGYLGRGLAKISSGDLAGGRHDIEVAVGLDSSSSLLRAYLGKAYFEERRYPLDSQQYEIAKTLDPLDPTAWLYDGILKQTINRPVEAARDLERSRELNDNRAVYRGQLLLDKDRAARGTSLARVYNDLSFKQVGVNESTQSLAIDPGNASAHRFLSDTYRDSRNRTDISRVSELLQAQMLQDININPIQPSISSTNLNIVTLGGPSTPGFNEFTPLFEQNRMQFNATGFAGNNDTRGGEAAVSAIHNNLSFSAGGMTFDTDGFRDNNDIDHKIVDVFGQWAISSALNVQMEYMHRDTEHGDLAQNFDLDDYDPNLRRKLDEDIVRLGARFTPNTHSNILLSFIHSDVDSEGETSFEIFDPFLPFPIAIAEDQTQDEEAYQYEAQYQYTHQSFNVVAGGAYTDVDIDANLMVTTDIFFLPFPDVQNFPLDSEVDDYRGYAYVNVEVLPSVVGTVGASYQDYDNGLLDEEELNPKLGVRWAVNDELVLRAAYFKVLKPALAGNRLLEPTQVAGFNQYFDDIEATKSTRYGVGLDWQPVQAFHAGTELTRRELEQPVIDLTANDADYEDRDEWNYRVYAYWTPADHWALSLEGVYDKFENENNSDVAFSTPSEVTTYSVPAKVSYFHPRGFFGSAGVTYVDQDVEREAVSDLAEGDSSFSVVDAAVGYRLPKRRGILSLSVQNLLDEDFEYQDDSYRTFGDQPYVGPYAAERTVMGQISINLP